MESHFKHEPKICPSCGGSFECKVGDVANCQCSSIKLTADAKEFISTKYTDCLCKQCLLSLSSSTGLFKAKFGHSPH